MSYDTRRIQKAQHLKAIILDSDGVIADPRQQHNMAIKITLEKFGFKEQSKCDYSAALMSASARQIFTTLIETDDLNYRGHANQEALMKAMYARKTQAYIEIIKQDIDAKTLCARSGIEDLLLEAEERAIPLGVASASNAEAVGALINKLGFGEYLSHNICPQGAYLKPDPRSYLKAMLGCRIFNPQDFGKCIAIEDTAVGAESALVAGMTVIITQSSFSKMDGILALAREGLSPDELRRVRKGKMPDANINTLFEIERGKARTISLVMRDLDSFSETARDGKALTIVDILDDMCNYSSRAS